MPQGAAETPPNASPSPSLVRSPPSHQDINARTRMTGQAHQGHSTCHPFPLEGICVAHITHRSVSTCIRSTTLPCVRTKPAWRSSLASMGLTIDRRQKCKSVRPPKAHVSSIGSCNENKGGVCVCFPFIRPLLCAAAHACMHSTSVATDCGEPAYASTLQTPHVLCPTCQPQSRARS